MAMKSPGLKSRKEFDKVTESMDLSADMKDAIFFFNDQARKAYNQRERNWE